MGVVKTAAVATAAAGGTMAVLAGLESMTSDDIRSCGSKIRDVTSKIGSQLMDTDFAHDLESKIGGMKYGQLFLDAASKAGSGVSSGFDKLVDTLAESKDEAVGKGQSVTGVLFGRLTDAVSTGAEFLSEHFPSARNAGERIANAYLDSRQDGTGIDAEQSGPDIDL